MKRAHACLVLAAMVTAAALTAEDKPTPARPLPRTTPEALQPAKTGYDLKAVGIATTGAPSYVPIFTFQNVGTKPITKKMRFWYAFDGTLVRWEDIPTSRPGQVVVVKGGGLDAGFGRYGHELEVFADCDNALREDDEHNNHLKKTLMPAPAPAPTGTH